MLIAILTYLQPLQQVDIYRTAHRAYLKTFFDQGKLLACGRQASGKGGVILNKTLSYSEFQALLDQDPFTLHHIASYEIIEFDPVFYDPLLQDFLS